VRMQGTWSGVVHASFVSEIACQGKGEGFQDRLSDWIISYEKLIKEKVSWVNYRQMTKSLSPNSLDKPEAYY
jgi:hypothetical protein